MAFSSIDARNPAGGIGSRTSGGKGGPFLPHAVSAKPINSNPARLLPGRFTPDGLAR
jgi:hypothetical protein